MSELVELPKDMLQAIVHLCASPLDNQCFPPSQPPLAPHCLWGAVDAMLTITAMAGTCKALQAAITDEAWAATMAVGLPLYAGAKVSASHWGMVKRQMLHALANRPSAPPVQDVGGVGGVWALLDIHNGCRSPWRARAGPCECRESRGRAYIIRKVRRHGRAGVTTRRAKACGAWGASMAG